MTKKYLKEQIRPEDSVKIINLLPDSSRKVLESLIDVHKWYDAKVYSDSMDAIIHVLGISEIRRFGEYTLENQMKFFGFFLRFMNLKKVIEKGPEMWEKIYSAGKVEIAQNSDDQVEIDVKEFPFTKPLALGVLYWCQSIIEKVTGKKVKGHYKKKTDTEAVFYYVIQFA